jgi:hypothetical protein
MLKNKRWINLILLAVLFLFLGRVGLASAQDPRQELNSLIQDTQKKSDRAGEMSFVWWIPQEYWQLSFAQNPSVTLEQSEKVLAVFKPYTVVAVVDGRSSATAGITYRPEAELRGNIKLKDKAGNIYLPMEDAQINVETKSFLAAMKPVLASVLGPMGQNMYFFVFPAQDSVGEDIANAKKEGSFSVVLDGDRNFDWTLPLSSLMPVKVCSICHRQLNGAYKYCPWDGTKLE